MIKQSLKLRIFLKVISFILKKVEMDSNSTDCYFMNTTSQLIVNLSVYGASTFIGAVSFLSSIVLILVAKGYKEFIYRLVLYMAVDGLIACPVRISYSFERDYNVVNEIFFTTDVIVIYLIYVYSFLLCWLGLYLFSLAVFKVQLKKTKHETIGLVTVLVIPLTFLWVFPWMTKNSAFCEDTYSFKLVAFQNIPNFSSVILTTIFIGAVLIILCKNAVNRVENTLQQQHRKAVREIVPFVIFVIAHQIAVFITTGALAFQLYVAMFKKNDKAPFFVWELFDLWPIAVISLPILLLSQPRIRHRIKWTCRRSPNVQVTTDNERATIIHQSSGVRQPSYSYCSIPHETSSAMN